MLYKATADAGTDQVHATLAVVLALAACGQERPAKPPPGEPLEVKGVSSPFEGFANHDRLVLVVRR